MKLRYGISDGALLQRDSDDHCRCRVALEAHGTVHSSIGTLTPCDEDGVYELTNIAVGGPYELTLSDDAGSLTIKIRVGDLWVLAGQSNMEGAGYFENQQQIEYYSSEQVRAYYLDNHWDSAVPFLHEPWISVDACQREVWKRNQLASLWHSELPPNISHGVPQQGVGPGLYFAEELYKITKVPQGVIPCALGGSTLNQWIKDTADGDNLYSAMLRRFKRTGSHIRGVFWYQGESEDSDDRIRNFTENMKQLIEAMRRDLNNPQLPFVQVQIATTSVPAFCNNPNSRWEEIREFQRTLGNTIPYMDTVASIDCELDDCIHLSGKEQQIVGRRAALSMAALCGFGGILAPKPDIMKIVTDDNKPFWAGLEISFINVKELNSNGVPSGFTITQTPDELILNPRSGISRIRIKDNKVYIFTELTAEKLLNSYVRYGYKQMCYCNIVSESGHAIPAFGPLHICDMI